MQLNIKSDEAYALANRLAALTGQSLTSAVTKALRQCLEQEERASGRDDRLRRVMALAAEIRGELSEDGVMPSLDHDYLYDDETGLPV